jgi:hypothetical protein
MNGDSIKSNVTQSYTKTATPTKMSDLGETEATSSGVTSATNNNVNVTVDVSQTFSAAFNGTTPQTNIEQQNPGLQREVKAHEDGHRDQIMEAANLPVSVTVNIDGHPVTFTGTADKVILDAAKSFLSSSGAATMNTGDRTAFVTSNITNAALGAMNNNISNVNNNPNKESNANSRAASTLGASTIKYNNGSTPVTFNGVPLTNDNQ